MPRWRLPVVVLLSAHAGLLGWCSYRCSPTSNEAAHLVAGLGNWEFGRFEFYRVNPPLTRMAAALPLLVVDKQTHWTSFYEAPGARPEFSMGIDFIRANGENTFWLMTLARWACIPFSVLGGWYCFRWGRDLYGPRAGLLALTLWSFSPDLIAHGSLITPDRSAAVFGLVAGYYFWRWLRTPQWSASLVAGIALGLAQVTKFTWLLLFGLWPLLWLMWQFASSDCRRSIAAWLSQAGQLILMCAAGLYMINLAYGFEHVGDRLGQFTFVSHAFTGAVDTATETNRFAQSALRDMPVPLPRNYLLGIDLQRHDFESFGHPSYLYGEWRARGWWHYYLSVALVKLPPGTWLLAILALVWCPRVDAERRWRDLAVVATPALAVFVLVSSQTGINHHFRYVLPALPFLFVWLGRVVDASPLPTLRMRLITVAAVSTSISSLSVYPHSLSYFHELAGGPRAAPRYALHSSLDWGQDLIFLRDWMTSNPACRPLLVAYYGATDAAEFGLDCRPLPKQWSSPPQHGSPVPDGGWYAISVNYVYGETFRAPGASVERFRDWPPVDRVGYSIRIYSVPYQQPTPASQTVRTGTPGPIPRDRNLHRLLKGGRDVAVGTPVLMEETNELRGPPVRRHIWAHRAHLPRLEAPASAPALSGPAE